MAKDEEIDFDNFDFDDMDDDFGLGESQSKKPTTAREAAVNSLKDGVAGFTEDIAGDPLATAVELAEKSLPNSIRSEVMDVKDVATTLRDEVKQATMDVRRAGTSTLKTIGSMMPDNSGMKNLLDKVVNFIGPDDGYDQQQEQISKEQAQNLEIQTGIIEALGNLTPDARQEALRQQIELNRSKSHQELMATTVSNGQKLLDYTYNVTNNYYRKSLELQYKHYYTSREQLGLLKTSLETFKLQFENIIKNTALPEIVKIQSSEQLKENLANRTREAITDVVYNELNPLKTFKEKATNKIRAVKDDFVEGFQTADEVADSASMLADMEEMGFTKSKIVGSFLGGGLKSFIGNKVGTALEDNNEFKKSAFNFKNAVNNPSSFASDQADKMSKKSFFGSDTLSNLLYSTADMFKPDDPRTLATFKKEDPESAAIFNYRTQNSITTVIPNLLSKIYGEVKSIRTGDENPEGNEVRWNDGKDKFETLADIAGNVKSSIKKTVSDKMGYGLNKMMDKIDPKKELSKDESSQVLSSLAKYLQETKDTTPIGLVKGKNSFLNYLPEELRPKLNKNLGAMVKNAKEDHYEYSDLNYTLKSLVQSIPNLIKEATTLYKTGNKKVLEDLGIMVTDDVSNTSYVDRNGIFKLVNQNIEEHGAEGFKEDIVKTESMAKYTGNKTQAELDALRKKEYKKKVKPRRSLEEVLDETSVAAKTKNKKNKDRYNYKKEFSTNKPQTPMGVSNFTTSKPDPKSSSMFKNNPFVLGGVTTALGDVENGPVDLSEHVAKMKLIKGLKFARGEGLVEGTDKEDFINILKDPSIKYEIVKMISSFGCVGVYTSWSLPAYSAAGGFYVEKYLDNKDMLGVNVDVIRQGIDTLYSLIPHEYQHFKDKKSGKWLTDSKGLSPEEVIANPFNYYTSMSSYDGNEYQAADSYMPFGNYFNRPWETIAYKKGYESQYKFLVESGRIDSKEMDFKAFEKHMDKTIKENSLPAFGQLRESYKQQFKQYDFPWYYDNDGKVDQKLMPYEMRTTPKMKNNSIGKSASLVKVGKFNAPEMDIVKTTTTNLNKKVDDVVKDAKAVYEDSINNNVNKVKGSIDKATTKIKDSGMIKDAENAIDEGKKTFNKTKRKAKKYSRIGKRKVNQILDSEIVTSAKDKLNKKVDEVKSNETYIEAMEKIDAQLDTITKEYLVEEEKLDKLFKDIDINVSVKEMRGRINKDGLINLFNTTKEKIDSTFKTGKDKVNKVYEDNKDKSTKDIVNDAKEKGKGLADNLSEIISDTTKGKISVKTSNAPLSGLDKLNHSDVSKVKHFGKTIEESKEKYEKYKDLDDKTENILREMYFKSEAYLLGKARSFGDYVKTFGYSPREAEGNISKNIIVDGLTQMSKEERIKKEQEFKKSLLDVIRLKKLSKEDDDALRFEFYNSPEYKAGAIKDYDKWLKDKGFRSHYSTPLISIKSILRKTRAFDRMVFNNLVAKPIKAIAKAPFKAAMGLGKAALNPVQTAKGLWKGTSTVGKLFKAVSTPALYAADGIASTVGLGFYGVKDNKYIAKAKDAIKYRGMSEEEIAYHKSKDTTVLDKGIKKVRELNKGVIGGTVRGIGKGLSGAASLGFKGIKGVGKLGLGTIKAVNPFGLGDKAPTKDEILKKYKKNKPNKTVKNGKVVDKEEITKPEEKKTSIVSRIKNSLKNKFSSNEEKESKYVKSKAKAPVKETKPKEPAYNDADGSGRRDGSWLDKLDAMKAAKEKAKNNPSPKQDAKPDDKKTSIFDMLKSAVGILGTIGGVAGSMLTGILAIKPLLSLISGGVSGVISAVTGGFSFLTKVPELLSGMMTKLGNIPSAIGKFVSNSFSALKGIGTTVAETVTGAVGKAKEVVGKVVESGKSMINKVTPDSIKAFYNKIKDMVFKKLGKKAGGKVALTLAGKIASRAVPIAGLALLTYDAAMITKDMLENNTDFSSAVSKQLLGFDIFSDTEPALDEDGKPIQPDEEYNSDDLAKSQGIDKEKDFENKDSSESKENSEQGFFSKLKDSVVSGGKSAYESGKGYISSAYEGVKKGVTTAIDYGKQALGGLVGSIPFPTGNGSWAALKDTIVGAAKAVGVDEKLMGVMGAIESGFNYTVKAGTSTATGLYQFIKSTWDSMVGKYGSKYGITKDTPPTEPRANALMGAEYLKENMSSLKSTVTGRDVNYTDAYMAHFLGIGGAKKFIKAMEKDPGQSAPDLFQAPAAANKSIFYVGGDTNKPRTLGDVYNSFTNKINDKSKSFGIGDLGANAPGPVPTSTTTTDKSSTGASSVTPTSNTSSSGTTSPSVSTSQPTTTSGSSDVPSVAPTPPVVQQQPQTVSKPENDNAKVLAEGNTLLNSISSTLVSSLEVQRQMATSLDNLSKMMSSNKTLNAQVEDLAKGVAPTFKSKPTGNSNNMPDVTVSLDKKNY